LYLTTGKTPRPPCNEQCHIRKLRLELGFPRAATIAVTAAGIAQDEELTGAGIAEQSFLTPPMSDGMSREGGGVMGDADHDRPAIGEQIIDAVGNGDARGIGAEVVIVARFLRLNANPGLGRC
jgi:hypothetical protein